MAPKDSSAIIRHKKVLKTGEYVIESRTQRVCNYKYTYNKN